MEDIQQLQFLTDLESSHHQIAIGDFSGQQKQGTMVTDYRPFMWFPEEPATTR